MRRRTPAAPLALAAALILSAPGHGSDSEAAAASTAAAPVCEASPAASEPLPLDELRRLAVRRALAGDADVVVLNGRGYNYGPPPDRQLDRIQLEVLKAEAELRRRP